ncbi:MAG: hypothetical protein RL885_14270 [Planctomycetota bacterium]
MSSVELNSTNQAGTLVRRLIAAIAFVGMALVAAPSMVAQPLDETWVVTVNGQTVTVNPDGSFRLPNVAAPDQFGPGGPGSAPDFLSDDFLRVVGTSSAGGVTRWVFSEPFQIRQGDTYFIENLTITDSPPPLVESIRCSIDEAVLTELGATTQVHVTGLLASGESRDVTARSEWTIYRTSNPDIVSIGPDGLVTAFGEGRAFITAVNEGATTTVAVAVSPGDPLTTVEGFVQLEDGSRVAGAEVSIVGFPASAVSEPDGSFSIPDVPAELLESIRVFATAIVGQERLTGVSESVDPEPDLITDVGLITLGEVNREVLILWDVVNEHTEALKTALENAGLNVTLSETTEFAFDGTNPPLGSFGCVIHLNGTTYDSDMLLAGQQALTDFVQAGGGFIHGEWNAYEIDFRDRMQAMRDITLMTRTSGRQGPIEYRDRAGQEGHPILANVPSSFSFLAGSNIGPARQFAEKPVTVLMTDEVGSSAVAVREVGAGRVVGFSHAGNYDSYDALSNQFVQQLYIDGVFWAVGVYE